MTDTKTFNVIADEISAAIKRPFEIKTTKSIAGGDINRTFLLQGETQRYFVKLNQPERLDMFKAECAGLHALAQTKTVKIPQPILYGQTETASFLVLEYIELRRATVQSERVFGQQLARLHLQKQPYFGWEIDNTIGSTQQVNLRSSNWVDFWRNHRLGFQLKLVISKGYGKKLETLGALLSENLDDFFTDYAPQPSLLHGDLWGGNVAANSENQPIIFDPACYYGDRETDLAMTELFGGFGRDFYAAYNDIWQLDSGYETRKKLYNLYHVLNHIVLFGGGYVAQAENIMQTLVHQIKA
jgi:protein-ribulosamine 3-kinase